MSLPTEQGSAHVLRARGEAATLLSSSRRATSARVTPTGVAAVACAFSTCTEPCPHRRVRTCVYVCVSACFYKRCGRVAPPVKTNHKQQHMHIHTTLVKRSNQPRTRGHRALHASQSQRNERNRICGNTTATNTPKLTTRKNTPRHPVHQDSKGPATHCCQVRQTDTATPPWRRRGRRSCPAQRNLGGRVDSYPNKKTDKTERAGGGWGVGGGR